MNEIARVPREPLTIRMHARDNVAIVATGWDLFRLMLDVASGRKTWAEHWHLQNSLALFNPGPVT